MPGEIWAQKPLDARGNMGTKTTRSQGKYGHKNNKMPEEIRVQYPLEARGNMGTKTTRYQKKYRHKENWMPGEIWAQTSRCQGKNGCKTH